MSLAAGLAGVSAFLLALSAILAAALAAAFKISDSRARILVREGFAGADALAAFRADRVGVVRLGALRAIFVLGTIATGIAAAVVRWGLPGLWGGAVVLLLIVLVGDVVPRGFGSRSPVRLALAAAPALRRSADVLAHLLSPLDRMERLISRGSGKEDGSTDERQVREALQIGAGEGIVESDEHRLVERAFELDERNAWDVMTPRVDVFAWKDAQRLGDIISELETVPHSRVPVYGESIDDVTGILHVRDVYRAYVAGKPEVPLADLAREPMFVPGSLSLAKLLQDFRTKRTHMGIVADEFGGTDGLITLEDVLEELVGEIVDETDVDDEPLTRLSADEVIAAGGAELRDINQRFGFALPEGDSRSLNGFIVEELGQVPEVGASLEAGGATIEVLDSSDTQVLRARLRRTETAREAGES